MGLRIAKFCFTPGENEQIETVITLPEEKRSIIHGYVKDHKNKLVKDAIVKLFEVIDCQDHHSLKPLTHTFTDECGQFLLGPLTPGMTYAIMVWYDNVQIRELVIRPEDCKKKCDDCLPCDDDPTMPKENADENTPFLFDDEDR